eukprot:304805-Chlamydomonas_euryale.AAC.1
MPRKDPPVSASRVSPAAMYSSYSRRWRLDSRQRTMCSCFDGICFSTSALVRRNKKGRSTPCSRSTSCLL